MMSERLSVLEDLLQGLRAEYVTQSGGGEQSSRVLSIFHVDHRGDRVEDAKVDDGVHGDRHGVLGQDLLRWHVKRDRSEVDNHQIVYAR